MTFLPEVLLFTKINVLNYMCARRAGVLQTLSKKENVKGRIL
jgi:hypothetical protein